MYWYKNAPHGVIRKRAVFICLLFSLALLAVLSIGIRPAQAATITVDTTADVNADDGSCSLREAMIAANTNAIVHASAGECIAGDSIGTDIINFNLSGSMPYIIQPTSELPIITGSVDIDGTTQAGYVDSPVIEIDGQNAVASLGNPSGLRVQSTDVLIRGLAVNNFADSGIQVSGTTDTGAGSDVTILENYIGTDYTGMIAKPNGWGVYHSSTTNLVLVSNNLISGNLINGIEGFQTSDGRYFGNKIGTNADESGFLPNGENGILLFGTTLDVIEENNISGNLENGIDIVNSTLINIRGINVPSQGNTISNNGDDGVNIVSVSANSSENIYFSANNTFDNGGLGISYDAATDNINAPVIDGVTIASDATVTGELTAAAAGSYTFDFYASQSCDPSGFGEGELFIGRSSTNTTIGAGATEAFSVAGLDVPPTGYDFYTAVASRVGSGGSSEFSACFELTPVLPGQTITVNTTSDEFNLDGDCSLREAIHSANTNTVVDACTAGGGASADTINVPAGTYLIEDELIVEEPLNILGLGTTAADTVIQKDPTPTSIIYSLIKYQEQEVDFSLSNLTVQDSNDTAILLLDSPLSPDSGQATFTNVILQNNGGAFQGGAIGATHMDVTIIDSVVTGNTANDGGGIKAAVGSIGNTGSITIQNSDFSNNTTTGTAGGGAVFGGFAIDINISGDSTFSNNSTSGNGAGVYSESGSVVIDGADFASNTATLKGGGLYVNNGSMDVSNATFDGNSANTGGALYLGNSLSDSTLSNSVITNNSSTGTSPFNGGGGGISFIFSSSPDATLDISDAVIRNNDTAGDGGGIHAIGGILNLAQVEVSQNVANGNGGGVDIINSTAVTMTNTTVSGNSADFLGGGFYSSSTDVSGHALNFTTIASNQSGNGGGGVFLDVDTVLKLNGSVLANNFADTSLGVPLPNDCVATNDLFPRVQAKYSFIGVNDNTGDGSDDNMACQIEIGRAHV